MPVASASVGPPSPSRQARQPSTGFSEATDTDAAASGSANTSPVGSSIRPSERSIASIR